MLPQRQRDIDFAPYSHLSPRTHCDQISLIVHGNCVVLHAVYQAQSGIQGGRALSTNMNKYCGNNMKQHDHASPSLCWLWEPPPRQRNGELDTEQLTGKALWMGVTVWFIYRVYLSIPLVDEKLKGVQFRLRQPLAVIQTPQKVKKTLTPPPISLPSSYCASLQRVAKPSGGAIAAFVHEGSHKGPPQQQGRQGASCSHPCSLPLTKLLHICFPCPTPTCHTSLAHLQRQHPPVWMCPACNERRVWSDLTAHALCNLQLTQRLLVAAVPDVRPSLGPTLLPYIEHMSITALKRTPLTCKPSSLPSSGSPALWRGTARHSEWRPPAAMEHTNQRCRPPAKQACGKIDEHHHADPRQDDSPTGTKPACKSKETGLMWSRLPLNSALP